MRAAMRLMAGGALITAFAGGKTLRHPRGMYEVVQRGAAPCSRATRVATRDTPRSLRRASTRGTARGRLEGVQSVSAAMKQQR